MEHASILSGNEICHDEGALSMSQFPWSWALWRALRQTITKQGIPECCFSHWETVTRDTTRNGQKQNADWVTRACPVKEQVIGVGEVIWEGCGHGRDQSYKDKPQTIRYLGRDQLGRMSWERVMPRYMKDFTNALKVFLKNARFIMMKVSIKLYF